MAYKTVANLRDSVSGMLQGLNLNNVSALNTAFERTARQVCIKLDIPEATLRSDLTLYDGVTDYDAPDNIFGAAIVDLRPQGKTRQIGDLVQRQPREEFDREKGYISQGYKVTLEYGVGSPILRVVSSVPTPRIELDSMSETTGWTAAVSASALTTDDTVLWDDPASLRFTLTGASTGTLTKATSSQDLTDYRNVGVVFIPIRIPSASLTSIELRIGSDASNYYSVTATTGFLQAFTANEWMLVAFDLSTATTTGTPVITAMDYVQLLFTHGATMTNVYVGDLWIARPSPHTIIYQSSAIFLAEGGTTPSTTITNNADEVLLNDAAYAIFEVECALTVAQQQGGTLASGVVGILDQKVNGMGNRLGLIDMYRADNPSEEVRSVGSFYDL